MKAYNGTRSLTVGTHISSVVKCPQKSSTPFTAGDCGLKVLAAFDANVIRHPAHVTEPRDRNLREECTDVLEVLRAQRFDLGGCQLWETGLEIAPHDCAPTALEPSGHSTEVLVELDREPPRQHGCEPEPSQERPRTQYRGRQKRSNETFSLSPTAESSE